jgi:2-oxoglutarate/2-oxoacid ferredoxin oxidoreductase subunit beta
MNANEYSTYETAWCPGCGNPVILESLKTALQELGLAPHDVLLVGGIGQAAKTPQYLSANAFCGLHGRALPPAVAAKIANRGLTVVVDTGDGDSYGEGGNHFIHNIRRNVNIAHFVHDNQVYGLTKGQSSPTSDEGFVTDAQPAGNINNPFNPIQIAIAAGAGFVARGFTGHKEQLVSLMRQAIQYDGYALLDILQPCVSFNKVNTFAWYQSRVYELGADYDPADKWAALRVAEEYCDKIPLGVLYLEKHESFHEKNGVLKDGPALIDRPFQPAVLKKLFEAFV